MVRALSRPDALLEEHAFMYELVYWKGRPPSLSVSILHPSLFPRGKRSIMFLPPR